FRLGGLNSYNEHIDGLISHDLVSILKDVLGQQPDPKPGWWGDMTKAPKSGNRKKKHLQDRSTKHK
ncbi:hypothetical protein, partial [Sansalvadorimonas verongulae]|uniref:hypothetical protein n=1 Tax=Sansalvadorimonas verongulae TaxID=2172824 RepID=UPI001E50D252